MADKLEGTAIIANTVSGDRIVTGSITTTQLAPSIAAFVDSGQPLKIRTITYPGDDTAANTGGGQTIVLTGTGFKQNVQVYINSNAVPSVTYANANSISFTAPALSAATYPVYVINTDDGATAILIPGIQYSGTPSWTTTTPLTTQAAYETWSIQLVATSDSAVSYSLQAGSSLPDGITLAANGLISGTMTSPPADETTYNFTVVANDLEQQDSSRAFSVSVTVTILDPYATYTTLLLHGDGTNNANNHAFVDSSNNNFTITRNGNATQGTFSPFGDNWSVYLDGNGDYLRTNLNAVNIRTAHTIEGWFYTTTSSGFTVFSCSETAGVGGHVYYLNEYQGTVYLGDASNNNLTFSANLIPLNQWFHIALTFDGATYKVFINGNLVASSTTLLINYTLNGIDIGARLVGVTQYTTGYISNYRVLKGTALYTSNFTPPTAPLTAIANTSLLTCQSNAFVDKGPNRFAITRNGDARVSKFDPFKPYTSTPISYGVFFDGSGDYLQLASNSAFNMNSYCSLEAWVCFTALGTDVLVAGRDSAYWLAYNFGAIGGAANKFTFTIRNTAVSWNAVSSTTTPVIGTWYHVVGVKDNNTLKIYVNGNLENTAAFSGTPDTGTVFGIAANQNTQNMTGHISNLRLVLGASNILPYTSNFTPSVTPLTVVSGTALLACQSTTIIDNSTNAFTITRNGDARATDFNPFGSISVAEKYSAANVAGSMYLDGTSDSISAASNTAFSFGTNPFTVELWYYPTVGPDQWDSIFSTGGTSGIFFACRSGFLDWTNNNDNATLIRSSWPTIGQWNHIVLTQDSSTRAVFINGVRTGTASTGFSWDQSGMSFGDATTGYYAGCRIIKGQAIYNPNQAYLLVPPNPLTTTSQGSANTVFLCNFTNAGIIDSVGKNVLETVGDARVNTSVKKYGTGSMYFDGSGDYLRSPYNPDLQMKTADFTVECWVYMPSAPADYGLIFNTRNSTAQYSPLQVYVRSTRVVEVYMSTNGSTNSSIATTLKIPLTTWTHLAVVRINGVVRVFIDGVLDGASMTVSSALYEDTTWGNNIGGESGGNPFIGNIDDLRITKGVARYRYNFTPPTRAFNDGDGNLATPTSDVLVGDQVNTPVFPYTTLLLHGDGTNNANNHAFVDSSNNNFAITRNGNATQGTFSPFSPTGWSGYFDGASYISVPDSADFTMGSGDFTIQCWVYSLSDSASDQYIVGQVTSGGTASATSFQLYKKANTYVAEAYVYIGGAKVATSGAKIPVGQWTHLAMVRDGGTMRLYVNGVQDGTNATLSTSAIVDSSGSVAVGRTGDYNGLYFNGYISNVSIVKGICLFPNGTTFTPSTTPLSTNQSGQSVLLCRENRFIDSNTTPKTVTISGARIQAFSPFAPSVEYTANTHGGSAYFDGTGDYLTTNATQAIPATGDFTVEAWIYPTISGGNRTIIAQGTSGTAGRLQFNTNTDNTLQLGIGSTIVYSTGTIVANAWNYVAFTRTGSSVAFYINGSAAGTATASGSVQNTTLAIGSEWSGDPYRWLGYIGSVRVSNVLRTINSITTAPFSNDANTVFLANFTNAGILDSTGKNVLETVGDAKVNTAIKKYGTGSMYFDGTGDGLNIRSNDSLILGTGDYTIECWVYHTSVSGQQTYVGDTPGNTNGPYFYKDTSHKVGLYYSSQVLTGSTTIAVNTWYHIAVSRVSGTVRLFVNGNQEASASDTTNLSVAIQWVGADNTSNYLNGYIDDLRVTKGIGRYVTNFTPPTAAFLNK